MPNVKYEKLVLCDAIVNKIRISKHRQASVAYIVDEASDLRKKA
jgi:hypothetical protein